MKSSTVIHIGFDDTDSRKGMCTTFLAYKIVEYLKKEQVRFLDYPYLIRFNPNVPWKTRGNGAVALKIETKEPQKIKRNIIEFIKKYSATEDGANPGLVFYENKEIPEHFSKFGKAALYSVVNRNKAREFAARNGLETFHLGNGQGLVGAIGAIGYNFRDHTFELISYRDESNFGKRRKILKDSVMRMQQITYPKTFNSFDVIKNRVLIAPHGPDPVFFGVRGEDINSVMQGASLVKSQEKYRGYMIFRSNQGTGDHLENELDIQNIKPFSSGYLIGQISEKPKIEQGGHAFFSVTKNGTAVKCAVYRPTGLVKVAAKLIEGDLVKVGAGVRKASKNHDQVLNVEFFEVHGLAKDIVMTNPSCTRCKKRMKSKGKGQGYKCTKCGKTASKRVGEEIPRQIGKQLYLPIPSAHRHLTRPAQRMGKINTRIEFDGSKKWFCNLN